MRILLPIILFFTALGSAYAQSGFRVEGKLMDGDSGKPLEYASVSVLQASDSSLVTGGVTDGQGNFSIPIKNKGKYVVRAEFISYNPKYYSVELGAGKKVANLGSITLNPDAETLEEVVVKGEKSQMVMELDKRVFNVGQDLSNIGASAADVLDNVPSVNVDIEGNVSLRGSSNVKILVNGKPSGLIGISSTDALRQLQGNLIERIEVVTNPSARYQAEGNAGIINIILKKDENQGINGSFTVNGGYPADFGVSANVNYRKKWVNMFFNYGTNYRNSPGSGYDRQEFFNDGYSTYRTTDRDRNREGFSHNIRAGADFYLDDKSTLTASGLYRFSDEDNTTDLTYRNYDRNRVLLADSLRTDNEKEDEDNMDFALNYTREFNDKGHKLTADLQYRESDEVEDSEQRQGARPSSGEDFNPNLFQRSYNEEFERNILFQTDYVYPFSENGKMEAGLRANIRSIDNSYQVEEQNEQGQFEQLSDFSNNFKYDENIYAAYFIYGNKINNFSYQVGVRSELTDITTQLVTTGERADKDYIGFFPSAHITYELANENSIQASYSRRLDRPNFWNLNPFFSYTDPRSIRSGNTDLDPEYTDAYEIGYLKTWSSGSVYSSVYYRYTTDVIDRVSYQDQVNGDTVIFSMPQNLSQRNSYGVEFTVSQDVGDWWKLNGNANFYHQATDGDYEGQDLSSDTYTMSARVTSKMTLFDAFDFQLSGRYRASGEEYPR
ncbi:TonB-dependent receptor family protein [Fulvivirga maritima]|uniref:outer membrane beta-barrel family protein n=1 Tax=Fulvivirga maritima TaxID=2904247 RepID=UPI001F3225BF|nr:outer membrane beta-barrel family protein [Fulvivirga maritima]UII26222.1 TonB-dependent receptor family protein [Fulvivirga maritima]